MNSITKTVTALYFGTLIAATACISLAQCTAQHVPAPKAEITEEMQHQQIISAAESRAIADVIEAEKQYEEMDYQFFNGDAEAYK
ncbi:Uncharacterised protein [Neisseria animaloris]|uniref:hypothetical protein n=1 Tax=Neisseria animaloris TaxID=326522 RepID=UPI000A1915B6|nr:hypothetical protein [Neisseria animaloris]OSI06805.1 hypothetical protein BWD08_10610 [Neisseria animaloris]VEH86537.1 Uncharacterised protein [Neisseria animaloris]